MKKMKRFRSVLAAGMAFALSAAPLSAFAETAGETEAAAVQETLGDFAGAYTPSASEFILQAEFGDALYSMAEESGQDLSWLENVSEYCKIVPEEKTMDVEVISGLNDTTLCTLLVSHDWASGTVYISIPELSDQTVAINLQELIGSVMSGGSQGDNSQESMMVQMVMGAFMQIYGQFEEFFKSLPEDIWQQEIMNYLTPVMSRLQQNVEEGVLTVGELSADVQVQTISLPSEAMSDIITDMIDAVSKDQLIEKLLKSDAVSSIFSFISQTSGGQVQISGQDLLDQMRAALDNVSKGDFSSIPGIVLSVQSSEDGSAIGFSVSLEMGGEVYDLITFKAIADGTEHAFELTPGAVLLAMAGLNSISSADLFGMGSNADDKLNEVVELFVNDEAVASYTITDFDLEAIQYGEMIGTFRCDVGDQSAELVYNVTDEGVRTVEYYFNDEVFYNVSCWAGEAYDDEIDKVDLKNVIKITSVEDAKAWIETIDMGALFQALAEAGVPLSETEASETEALAG